jgi:phytoene/squalene synthetase
MASTPLKVPTSASEQGEIAAAQSPPGRLPDAQEVMGKSRLENFRVANPILPRPLRADLYALYGFARLVDDIGDEAQGGRLSADPVGHLVLYVFDRATPERMALSDHVCSGLQIVEHLQDVAEDLERGRVYLPMEDMERHGCKVEDLSTRPTPVGVRQVVAFEALRARRLLDQGAPLARTLPWRAGLAVAGFVAGGRAALGAIERRDHDVLSGAPRASQPRRLAAFLSVLFGLART